MTGRGARPATSVARDQLADGEHVEGAVAAGQELLYRREGLRVRVPGGRVDGPGRVRLLEVEDPKRRGRDFSGGDVGAGDYVADGPARGQLDVEDPKGLRGPLRLQTKSRRRVREERRVVTVAPAEHHGFERAEGSR